MNHSMVGKIYTHFENTTDPRVNRGKNFCLLEMVFITLCATICGASDWMDVERYGKAKLSWLRKYFPLDNGIPSHDTFSRVFSRLETVEFYAALQSWSYDIAQTLKGKHVAIDGKTLRGSHDRALGKSPVEGGSSWLHVLVGSFATYYYIDPTRSGQPIIDLLGKGYAGKLVHDGWSVYDTLRQAEHQQCLAHVLRRIDALIDSAKGTLCEDAVRLKAIFQRALATRDRFLADEITVQGCRIAAGKFLGQVVDFLLLQDRSDPAMNRILNFLDKHNQALFTFLKFPGEMDATNWRAE